MIYKQCVLTIAQNTATLDEDIYLFRLDKNIQLYFTIVNNKYKFDKSDLNNIINITNASFFQVRLYKDDQIKYTFAIQPTEKGQAILTITDQLIDEPVEVGDYDFQISLLDADKTSMISMPIVSQQLHVCEPLVDNQAIMGKAVLGLSSLASGEIKNAFDSEGNYIREIHKDGDILSAQLVNKFEEGILQAHIEALANKIPKVTPPKGQTTSDIINLYNVLPNDSLVYLTEGCMIQNTGLIGLCSIYSYNSDEKDLSENNVKSITCYNTGVYVDITSTGHMVDKGLTNVDLSSLMEVLRDSQRKTGQVFTMTSDNEYGWADVIPKVTPPKGASSSDITTFYNELPDNGSVYITEPYSFTDDVMVGYLCEVETQENQVKMLTCGVTGMYVYINAGGYIEGSGVCNPQLDELTSAINAPSRQQGQVFTMKDDNTYGWADVIPKITPPEGTEQSDIVTLYNALPDKGLVYITKPYPVTDDVMVGYLCEVATIHKSAQPVDLSDESTGDTSQNTKSIKTIACYATGMCVDITSTGVVEGFGMVIPQFNDLMGALTSQTKKKGQVLTMIDDNTFDWADTTPKICIHDITGNAEVQLTLDPYQLIDMSDATPQDLSPKYTVDILTPNIEESDNHVYKIHVMFMADPKIVYIMPSGMYDHPPTELTDGIIYEFIFTYINPYWLVHCIEYNHEVSNAPQ